MPEPTLRNRVAVVTGAGGRLGGLLVDRLVREGAAVAAVVHQAENTGRISFSGEQQGRVFQAGLSREDEVRECFQHINRHFGRIDILVHAVGAWAAKPLLETSLEEWEALMRTNLTSAFLCFREAARHMEGRSGRLIAFAAAQGADQGRARQGAYAASKAGIIRLVESVAEELAETGITACAVAPSTILYETAAAAKGVPAEDLLDLCVYLCSSAGAALNGQTLRAYGSVP